MKTVSSSKTCCDSLWSTTRDHHFAMSRGARRSRSGGPVLLSSRLPIAPGGAASERRSSFGSCRPPSSSSAGTMRRDAQAMNAPADIEIRVLDTGDVDTLRELLHCFADVFDEPDVYLSQQPDGPYLRGLLSDTSSTSTTWPCASRIDGVASPPHSSTRHGVSPEIGAHGWSSCRQTRRTCLRSRCTRRPARGKTRSTSTSRWLDRTTGAVRPTSRVSRLGRVQHRDRQHAQSGARQVIRPMPDGEKVS